MVTKDYGLITSMEELQLRADKLAQGTGPIGFDIETGYLGQDQAKGSLTANGHAFIVGFSFTDNPDWARYVPLRHDFGTNLDPEEVWGVMKPVLEQPGRIVAHNLKFEMRHMQNEGIELGILSDTMLEAYCLSEWPRVGLKELVQRIFNHRMVELIELFPGAPKNKKPFIRFNTLDTTPDVVAYACEDSAWCLSLHEMNYERVLRERPIFKLEMEILKVLVDMENRGMAADWASMEQARDEGLEFLEKKVLETKQLLGEMAGKSLLDMNLKSIPQLRKLLYTDIGLTTSRTTKKGDNLSTDSIALTKLAMDHPPIKSLLEVREVENLVGRFNVWLDMSIKKPMTQGTDGRAHANYGQAVVGAGRFAANDPAIQQCPKKWHWELKDGTTWEGNFRSYLVAAPEHYLLSFDYSQIELRVLAGHSQEPALLDAYRHNRDIHTITAGMMLGKPPSEVDKETERPVGKAQPLSSQVWTPNGPVLMQDVSEGMEVSTPSGTARVVGVFPQGVRTTYRVTSHDGASAEADAEHLWQTQRGLVKTCDLRERDIIPTSPWIPARSSVGEVDPYTLGILLGDCSFSTHGLVLCIATGEEEILERLVLPSGVSAKVQTRKSGHTEYRLSIDKVGGRNPLRRMLAKMRLAGCRDEGKFVPQEYMTASYTDRLALVRGLLDSDGYAATTRLAEFVTVSKQLALDMQQLVWSLGGTATLREKATQSQNGAGQTAYRMNIALLDNPFLLKRKAAKVWRTPERRVATVQEVREVEVQCIALDDPAGLYLTDDFVVTHNTMNFALIYGMGPQSLSERLGIAVDEAKRLYANYFEGFPAVTAWIDKTKRECKHRGYSLSWAGRKNTIWDLLSSNKAVYSKGERLTVNSVVQGGAADLMKVAMVKVMRRLQKEGWWNSKVFMVLNVHDSLTFEVSNELSPMDVLRVLRPVVELQIDPFPVMVSEWELGPSWGQSVGFDENSDVRFLEGQWRVVDGSFEVEDDETFEVETSPDTEEEEVAYAPPAVVEREGPRELVVVLAAMPVEEDWLRFVDYVRSLPGETEVSLETPEGIIPMGLSGLDVGHQPRVAMLLPGARVQYKASSVDVSDLAGGMTL